MFIRNVLWYIFILLLPLLVFPLIPETKQISTETFHIPSRHIHTYTTLREKSLYIGEQNSRQRLRVRWNLYKCNTFKEITLDSLECNLNIHTRETGYGLF